MPGNSITNVSTLTVNLTQTDYGITFITTVYRNGKSAIEVLWAKTKNSKISLGTGIKSTNNKISSTKTNEVILNTRYTYSF
ncbi:MAG: hypothetical protein K6357_04920 [Elusimicrobiota bacterium]